MRFFFLSIFLLTSVLTKGQDEKEEAKAFFLTVVKTYFDGDCDKFYSLFNDSIAHLSPYGEGIASAAEVRELSKACEKFSEFTNGISSFEQYKTNYKILVLDKNTFTIQNKETEKLIKEYKDWHLYLYEVLQSLNKYYTPNDYLVLGDAHISDRSKDIRYGLYWIIVRKTKDGWRIFATPN